MDRGVSHGDRDADKCPYFAGSTAAAASRTCLAGDKPVTVSRRYAESYCTSRLHVTCALYVAVREESSDATAPHSQGASAPPAPDTPTVEPALTAEMPALVADPPPQSAPAETVDRPVVTPADEERRPSGRAALGRWAVGALVAALALIGALLLNLQRGDETSQGRVGDAPGPGVLAASATRGIAMATTASVAPTTTEPTRPTEIVRATRTRAVPTPTTRAPATDTPAPAPTATPTKVPASPTPRATETPRPPQRLTGLGLPRSRWEADHGAAENEVGGLFYYEGRGYQVGFTAGRVVSITRDWGVQPTVRIGTARARARALLPEDAVLVRTDTLADNLTVEVYTSRTLLRAFPPDSGDSWPGRSRGAASVVYRQNNGLVDSITVQVGELSAET